VTLSTLTGAAGTANTRLVQYGGSLYNMSRSSAARYRLEGG